jgi:Predicted protein-tyrosine phosphatase
VDTANSPSRTSLTHPLRIAELPAGQKGGAVGVTFAPGKHQPAAMTGSWSRDLDEDLRAIKAWGATILVSLIEPWEFEELRIEKLPHRAAEQGLEWYGLPIVDGAAPDERWLGTWRDVGQKLAESILSGGRVVVHCKGGLGRAGTVASMLLLQTGEYKDSQAVMKAVREARVGAIETKEQEEFIRGWADRLSGAEGSKDS